MEAVSPTSADPDSEKLALEKDRQIVDDELRYWVLEGTLDEDVHLPSFWDVRDVVILRQPVC